MNFMFYGMDDFVDQVPPQRLLDLNLNSRINIIMDVQIIIIITYIPYYCNKDCNVAIVLDKAHADMNAVEKSHERTLDAGRSAPPTPLILSLLGFNTVLTNRYPSSLLQTQKQFQSLFGN
jgi:hypothetical protein